MARIRSIKPDFWASEQILDLSIPARLAFIGLWNFSDDDGLHKASVRSFKAQVFPAGDVSERKMANIVSELMAFGLLRERTDENGTTVWQITGWHHQKIDRPQPSRFAPLCEESSNVRRTEPERSPLIGRDGKGKDGKGKDGKGKDGSARATRWRDEDVVPTEWMTWAQDELGMTPAQCYQQRDRFVDHYLATGKVMKQWERAWRGWCRRAPDFGPRAGNGAAPRKSAMGRTLDGIEKFMEQQNGTRATGATNLPALGADDDDVRPPLDGTVC